MPNLPGRIAVEIVNGSIAKYFNLIEKQNEKENK